MSDELANKLTRVIVDYDPESDAEAIEYSVDTVLAQDQALTPSELARFLQNQLE